MKREHHVTFMKGNLKNDHAELTPPIKDDEEVWYLPLFGVYHPKKKDKIRGIFDSSAVFDGVIELSSAERTCLASCCASGEKQLWRMWNRCSTVFRSGRIIGIISDFCGIETSTHHLS